MCLSLGFVFLPQKKYDEKYKVYSSVDFGNGCLIAFM